MTRQIGPRGFTVLVIVGIAGLLLAVLGWTQRGTAPVAPRSAGIAAYQAVAGTVR